jgi:hypothetical protein
MIDKPKIKKASAKIMKTKIKTTEEIDQTNKIDCDEIYDLMKEDLF